MKETGAEVYRNLDFIRRRAAQWLIQPSYLNSFIYTKLKFEYTDIDIFKFLKTNKDSEPN